MGSFVQASGGPVPVRLNVTGPATPVRSSRELRMKPRGMASSLTSRLLTVSALLAGVWPSSGPASPPARPGRCARRSRSPPPAWSSAISPSATSRCSPSSSPTRHEPRTPSAPPPPSPAPTWTTSSASPSPLPQRRDPVVLPPTAPARSTSGSPRRPRRAQHLHHLQRHAEFRRLHLAQRYGDHRLLPGVRPRDRWRTSVTPRSTATRRTPAEPPDRGHRPDR